MEYWTYLITLISFLVCIETNKITGMGRIKLRTDLIKPGIKNKVTIPCCSHNVICEVITSSRQPYLFRITAPGVNIPKPSSITVYDDEYAPITDIVYSEDRWRMPEKTSHLSRNLTIVLSLNITVAVANSNHTIVQRNPKKIIKMDFYGIDIYIEAKEPIKCMSYQRKCPDGSCVSRRFQCLSRCLPSEKKCWNKECVKFTESCPGQCGSRKKKCPDGSCVKKSIKCMGEVPECQPNEGECILDLGWTQLVTCYADANERCEIECPLSQPNKCGRLCYKDEERCDGTYQCVDGSDEQNCVSMPTMSWVAIPIIIVCICACSIGLYVYGVHCRRKRRLRRTSIPTSREDNARSVPLMMTGHTNTNDLHTNNQNNVNQISESRPNRVSAHVHNETDNSAPPSYEEALRSAHVPRSVNRGAEALPPAYDEVGGTRTPRKGI